MAFTGDRTIIACSVSVLAILLTLYYWRTKKSKQRSTPTSSDQLENDCCSSTSKTTTIEQKIKIDCGTQNNNNNNSNNNLIDNFNSKISQFESVIEFLSQTNHQQTDSNKFSQVSKSSPDNKLLENNNNNTNNSVVDQLSDNSNSFEPESTDSFVSIDQSEIITENQNDNSKDKLNANKNLLESFIPKEEIQEKMHLKNMSFNFSKNKTEAGKCINVVDCDSKMPVNNNNGNSKRGGDENDDNFKKCGQNESGTPSSVNVVSPMNACETVKCGSKSIESESKTVQETVERSDDGVNHNSKSVIKGQQEKKKSNISDGGGIKMIGDNNLSSTSKENNECNSKYNQRQPKKSQQQQSFANNHNTNDNQSETSTTTTSSSIVDAKKEKEVTGCQKQPQQNRQTFAQILSNNCDSASVVTKNCIKSDSGRITTASPTTKATKKVITMKDDDVDGCSINDESDGNESNSNNELIAHDDVASKNSTTKTTSISKDENVGVGETCQSHPDITTLSDKELPQVVNAINNHDDGRSQGSNESGQGSYLDTTTVQMTQNYPTAVNGTQATSINHLNNIQSSPIYHVPDNQTICYNFEVPIELCGFLIGKRGRFINPVKNDTRTRIVVRPFNGKSNICSIYGARSNVINALNRIRERFPEESYPEITLKHIELTPTIPLSQACQLHLPVDVMAEVILSYTVDPGHFFLQQPTHPTYNKLSHLDQAMKENYSQADAPLIPQVYPGLICAAQTSTGDWYRASVTFVHETGKECDLLFVDYGGLAIKVPVDSLRQIHYNFMSLPFQASECYLARVQPANPDIGWTSEATEYFQQLANGQVIYTSIEFHTECGIPCVNLFKTLNNGETNNFINISEELVNNGHARWLGQ